MIYSGKFKVTSIFGNRTLNGKTAMHKGIDVVGVASKNICAVAPGIVRVSTIITDKTNRTWEWGNYVRVDGDDGHRYYYCHMDKRFVRAGQRVNAGDHLGVEGNTGYSFGSHCHFEVRDAAGKSINPAPFLGIENRTGTYGGDYRSVAKKRFGFDENTMRHLDNHPFPEDLYRKLATKK